MADFDETFEAVAASLPDLSGTELQALLAAATHVARNAICITDADIETIAKDVSKITPKK